MNNLYLPEYAAQIVQRPGAVVGKGGNPHQYLVDGAKFQRVTTILDKTVPKPALINWARNVAVDKVRSELIPALSPPLRYYRDVVEAHENWPDATAVPVNTEWLDRIIDVARKEPDRVKVVAADWGTGAHATIQHDIQYQLGTASGHELVPTAYCDTLEVFRTLAVDMGITWRATEMIVWSNTLRVAGTVDAVGQLPDGSWILMDWKTGEYKPEWVKKYKSGFFWPEENALQLAAYAAFFTEVTGHPVSQAWVVRFPRNQPRRIECPACYGNGPASSMELVGIPGADPMYGCDVCAERPGELMTATGTVPAPGFEARQVANLEATALHYEMLVDHFHWLKQSPWVKEEK